MKKNSFLLILAPVMIPLLLLLSWNIIQFNDDQQVDMVDFKIQDRRISRIEQTLEDLVGRLDLLDKERPWPVEAKRESLEPVTPLTTELEYHQARLKDLEETLALLKARVEYQTGEAVPEGLSADVLRQMIGHLKGSDVNWKKQRREKRIELGERFLRDFPTDPNSPAVLSDLISEYIYAGQYGRAREKLENLGPVVNMDQVRQISISANLHLQAGDFDAAREDYNVIALMPDLSESRIADNLFWIAYSYFDEGRYQDAINHFQAIIDRYGADPTPRFNSVVGGAKNHLEKAKKYLGK